MKDVKVKFYNESIYRDPESGELLLHKVGGNKSDWIDLRASEDIIIPLNEFKLIPLGVAMQLPEGYEALVVPRSSTFKTFGIIQTNHVGIIDEKYCGDDDQWFFPAFCLEANQEMFGRPCCFIEAGERICQFRIIEHQPDLNFNVVEALNNPNRGGHGSTGTK